MASIFTKIVKGEIPCYKIAESRDYLAFLDIFPLVKGHALVIPKKEVDYIFDLDDETLAGLHVFSKKVANVVQRVVPCKRIGTVVMGMEVPHAHIHLIPMNSEKDLNFSNPKLKFSRDEFEQLAAEIRKTFENTYND